jgi:hypothetical protein
MRARISLVFLLVLGVPLSARAHGRHVSEEAQRRAMMSELAAAAAEAPKEEATDGDLMYAAMRQWHGEPRGTAAVNKVIAESKKDSLERKELETKAKTLFFKDPFADDPSQLIPVRKVDRMLLANYEARHDIDHERPSRTDEVSRLRDQLAQARADAAAARAEASRLRNELAHAGNDKSDGECVALASHPSHARVHGSHPMQSNDRDPDWTDPAPVRHHHRAKPRVAPDAVAAVAPAPAEVPSTAPAGLQSSDPRGIIVVPIDTPVAISANIHR